MKPWSDTITLKEPLLEVSWGWKRPSWADLEKRFQEYEADGFQRGRCEGERTLSEQLVQQRAELIHLETEVLAALRQSLPQVLQTYHEGLIDLTVALAKRFVADLPFSPERVRDMVSEALGQIEQTSDLTVLVHPEDLELLKRLDPSSPEGNRWKGLKFQAAPELARGGCLVQTRFGTVDARIETKERLLKEAVGS